MRNKKKTKMKYIIKKKVRKGTNMGGERKNSKNTKKIQCKKI